MRNGYTTGSCAAAAAKAALFYYFTKSMPKTVVIDTPKGEKLTLVVETGTLLSNGAECAVKKDGGDDPDVTTGLLIYAKVIIGGAEGIRIDGGKGVGRVTKKGLEQPVGAAAINRVPREMIAAQIREVFQEFDHSVKADVTIHVPGGEEVAGKTFNGRLGILGGISILGTSGIVVPMSTQAILDTIRVEMKQKVSLGAEVLFLAPGNYGSHFALREFQIKQEDLVLCSNFIGVSLDIALELQVKKILYIGHIGKFVKVAGGIMNTHSKEADCRAEIMATHTALVGGSLDLVKRIAHTNTTEEALALLTQENIREEMSFSLIERIQYYLQQRAQNTIEIGVLLFSNEYGLLAQTSNVNKLLANYTT